MILDRAQAIKKVLRLARQGDCVVIAGKGGLYVFFNRLTTLVALPPYRFEQLPDRWYFRIFRPLLAHSLRRSIRTARPEPLKPDERQGIFSRVVVGLDGLPLAPALRLGPALPDHGLRRGRPDQGRYPATDPADERLRG